MGRAWVSTSVGECLVPVPITGKTKIQARDYKPAGRFPVVDQGQEQIAGWTDDESAVIDEPLPLIIFGDHTRVFKFVDQPFARGADGTQLLRPKPDIDPLFFFYACRAIELPGRGYNRHFTVLKEKELAYPPDTNEQRLVASALRKTELSLLQQTAVLDNLQELKRAAMRELFTRGLRGEPQNETEIGPVPESWEIVSLGSVALARGGTSFPPTLQGKDHGDLPFYKVSDMNLPGNEVEMHSSVNWIDRADADQLRSKPFPRETIIFPKVGGALHTNKKRLLSVESLVDNNIMGVTVLDSERCLPKYLFGWFQTVNLSSIANAGPLPSINGNQLYELKLPIPRPDEQREIVAILDAIDRKIALHRQKRAVLEELFKALLHKLMTGEIRVTDLDLSALEPHHTSRVAA